MGKDLDPRYYLPHPAWGSSSFNYMRNLRPPQVTLQQNANSMVFPAKSNPYELAFSGNVAVPFPGFQVPISGLVAPSMPTYGLHGIAKSLMVFDHSGDQTSLIFSSPTPHLMNQGQGLLSSIIDIQGSNGTNVTNGNDNKEMHEDTDEIDALLYSGSEDYAEDEEASTGHSPAEITAARSNEEVASSSLPAKKRRLNSDIDESLVDTASSARAHCCKDDDTESSCVGGGGNGEIGEQEEILSYTNHQNKRMKRERIQETVGLLCGIIPGVKGKDTATILDEAISYLKSLKHKAKALGATTAV
ncbi:transcription factor SAC51 [Typha angustifolia]|uniref:transcription factor SAC51 n=1 Tax=Typha angustifolia TaxID=59011 RepID=UPI003C2B12F4